MMSMHGETSYTKNIEDTFPTGYLNCRDIKVTLLKERSSAMQVSMKTTLKSSLDTSGALEVVNATVAIVDKERVILRVNNYVEETKEYVSKKAVLSMLEEGQLTKEALEAISEVTHLQKITEKNVYRTIIETAKAFVTEQEKLKVVISESSINQEDKKSFDLYTVLRYLRHLTESEDTFFTFSVDRETFTPHCIPDKECYTFSMTDFSQEDNHQKHIFTVAFEEDGTMFIKVLERNFSNSVIPVGVVVRLPTSVLLDLIIMKEEEQN